MIQSGSRVLIGVVLLSAALGGTLVSCGTDTPVEPTSHTIVLTVSASRALSLPANPDRPVNRARVTVFDATSGKQIVQQVLPIPSVASDLWTGDVDVVAPAADLTVSATVELLSDLGSGTP